MNKKIFGLLVMTALLLCFADDLYAQGRPKMRELSERKLEDAIRGVTPMAKKDKWGYADADGKFLIRPVFNDVMPMNSRHVGFVSYINDSEEEVWTPISINGSYLTYLEFDAVIKDFDEKGLAVVRKGERYGLIDHTGKMVLECIQGTFKDRGPVYLFRRVSTDNWVAIAKDGSDLGYTQYEFAQNVPIIIRAEDGYGIISPRNQSVVAEFVYDSVREYVPRSVYVLQKGSKKYLYAADCLSDEYDDIVPGPRNEYFVVEKNGLYGVMSQQNVQLLPCNQTQRPILQSDRYTCFMDGNEPVYVKPDSRLSADQYDDYLYEINKSAPVEYILDKTLPMNGKKHVEAALKKAYGTVDFDRLWDVPQAVNYAEDRKLALLSSNSRPAKYLDLETGDLMDAGYVVYHAFPAKNGSPAFVSAKQNDMCGIVDVRNRRNVVPFEYDRIVPCGGEFAELYQADSVYLYNIADALIVDSRPREMDASEKWAGLKVALQDWKPVVVEKDGKHKYINMLEYRWRLPEDHTLESVVEIPCQDTLSIGYAAFMKSGSKGALYSLDRSERLTDYLFETVEDRLFGDKYNVVSVGGRKGLYDIVARKYVISCAYDRITDYCRFGSDEFAVVSKDGKYGLYNITKNTTVIALKNRHVVAKDGYAIIKQAEDQYMVYSLKQGKMVFDTLVKGVDLLKDGYAIVTTKDKFGIYDLDWNEWHIDMQDYYESYSYYFFSEINEELILVPEHGILNYKTRNWVLKDNLDWAYHAGRVGDYVEMRGGFEAESAAVYSLKENKFLMEYHSTYLMNVLAASEDPYLNGDYVIFASYGVDEEARKSPAGESWIPWNDNEGGAGLYDLTNGRWVFENVSGLEYIGHGLIWVRGQGLYDISMGRWALQTEKDLRNWEDLNDLYVEEKGEYGNTYFFDKEAGSFIMMLADFKPSDYMAIKEMNGQPRYIPVRHYNKWEIFDAKDQKRIQYECDRISLMYLEKKITAQ